MIKKDLVDASDALTAKFQKVFEGNDIKEKLDWIGESLGLVRVVIPGLPDAIRNRNHPYQPENILNIETYMRDTYVALLEATSYTKSVTG